MSAIADNTTLDPGAGGDVIATDDVAGVKYQRVKLVDGTLDSTAAIPGDAANGLDVDVTRSALPSGASTAAKQPALGTAGAASVDVITVQGVASMTAVKVDGSGVTQPVSGTVTASGPLTDTQLRASAVPVSGPLTDTQLRASAVPVDSELPAAGALADGASNPSTSVIGAFLQCFNGTTWDRARGDTTNGIFVNVKASALPTGAATAAKQPALGTAGAASADVLSVQGVASMTALKVDGSGVTQPVSLAGTQSVNQAQVAGTTTDTNSGTKSAGTQRVVLATDQPQLTNALKVDGSAVTQPVSGTVTAQLAATTTGGLSKFHLVSAGSTNATNVKASAGKLHGWYIYNSNAAARKVVFHNTAGTPTAGSAVTDAIVIPPTSAANAFTETGITFATGIAITTVTDLTDAGATAVAASDLVINLYFA